MITSGCSPLSLTLMTREDSEYLAKPSGDCCLTCFPHEGIPKGSWVSIEGIQTYVATPTDESNRKNRILVYYPDVWGISSFVNGQLLVDYFAAQGYLTLAIDYFRGVCTHYI